MTVLHQLIVVISDSRTLNLTSEFLEERYNQLLGINHADNINDLVKQSLKTYLMRSKHVVQEINPIVAIS